MLYQPSLSSPTGVGGGEGGDYALLCLLLNFNNGSNGSGKSSNTTSVTTFIPAVICMNNGPFIHRRLASGTLLQACDIGVQAKSWVCDVQYLQR
jgi:hypothetical protein